MAGQAGSATVEQARSDVASLLYRVRRQITVKAPPEIENHLIRDAARVLGSARARRHLIRLGELAADHDLTDLQNTLLPQFEAELNAASDWAVRGGIDAPPFQQRKDSKGSPLRNICRSAAI